MCILMCQKNILIKYFILIRVTTFGKLMNKNRINMMGMANKRQSCSGCKCGRSDENYVELGNKVIRSIKVELCFVGYC